MDIIVMEMFFFLSDVTEFVNLYQYMLTFHSLCIIALLYFGLMNIYGLLNFGLMLPILKIGITKFFRLTIKSSLQWRQI